MKGSFWKPDRKILSRKSETFSRYSRKKIKEKEKLFSKNASRD